jgi:hypothetical protein
MKLSYECESAARAYVLAKAHEATVRSVVEPIQAEIIRIYKPMSKKLEPIPEYRFLYQASDEVAHEIYGEVERELRELHPAIMADVKPGYCPLLMAEQLTRDCKKLIVETFTQLPGLNGHKITWERLVCAGIGHLDQFVELSMNLAAGCGALKGING